MDILALRRSTLPLYGFRYDEAGDNESGRGGDRSYGGGSDNGGGGGGGNRGSNTSSASDGGLSDGSLGSGLTPGGGLGFNASYGYSSTSPSLGEGLVGGLGLSPGGFTLGGDIGAGLNGYDMGLSPSQRADLTAAINSAPPETSNILARIFDFATSLFPPVMAANVLYKVATGKTFGQSIQESARETGLMTSEQATAATQEFSRRNPDVAGDFHGDGPASLSGSGAAEQNTGSSAAANTNGDSSMGATQLSDLFSMFQASGGEPFQAPEYNADPLGVYSYYMNNYEPLNRQMIAQVNQFNDPTYQGLMRSRAMADIQSQSDQQMGIQARQLARMGVNPSAGRYAAMGNQAALATAAAKVGAAANSDTTLRNAYMSGLSALNTQGMELAKFGNEASKAKSAFTLGASELGLKNTANQQANALGWGNLAANVYGIDKGAQTSLANTSANNAAAADRQSSDNLAGMVGLGTRYLFGAYDNPKSSSLSYFI